jgi:hypothetical protein
MKIINNVLALVFFVTIFFTAHSSETHKISPPVSKKNSSVQALLKKYTASILPGAVTGGITGFCMGKMCALNKNIAWPYIACGWVIECGVRYLVVNGISDEWKKNGVKHHPDLMIVAAWMASWLAFTYAYYSVPRVSV